MKKLLWVLVTSASPLFVLSQAAAATKPATQLPSVTVTATKESMVAPSVETAEAKIQQIPGGAAVVPSEEFKQTRAVTIKDMLDYTPGVFAQSRVNEEARLSIRGSGLSRTFHLRGIKLLQDGIPVNLADGAADFQDIDPLAFRYVEVYKGANALQYGANSLGGAINFVMPTGYDADRFSARLEGGSFGTIREQLSSGQVIGNTDYFASITNLRSDGYRDFSEQNNTRFNGNIGQKLSDSLETRFYVTYADINQELPGGITKAQLNANPKQANAGQKANNHQRDFTNYRIANKTTWRGDNVEVNGGIYTTQKDLYHPIFQLVDQQNSDYGVFGNTTFFGNLAGHRNELTLGTNLSTGETDSKRYVNLAGNYGALTYAAKEKSRNGDVFFENRFYAQENLALIAGSQFTYAKREFDDRFLSDGNRSGSKDYQGASPKIGALWEWVPGIQFFTNLNRAYEAPTFSELTQFVPGVSGLANIDAQKSTTFEVGTRGTKGRFNWDASVYRSWLKDELFSYSLGGTSTAVLNADKTVHQGLELAVGATVADNLFTSTDKLSTRIAYSFNDFSFDDDPQWGNNQIPGAPEQYIRAELRYQHPQGWYVAPNVEVVPDGYAVDMANTLYTDSYALLGLQAGYEIRKNIVLFVDGRNLTDEIYAATTGVITTPNASNSAQFIPGDGRAVYAGVTYKW